MHASYRSINTFTHYVVSLIVMEIYCIFSGTLAVDKIGNSTTNIKVYDYNGVRYVY